MLFMDAVPLYTLYTLYLLGLLTKTFTSVFLGRISYILIAASFETFITTCFKSQIPRACDCQVSVTEIHLAYFNHSSVLLNMSMNKLVLLFSELMSSSSTSLSRLTSDACLRRPIVLCLCLYLCLHRSRSVYVCEPTHSYLTDLAGEQSWACLLWSSVGTNMSRC